MKQTVSVIMVVSELHLEEVAGTAINPLWLLSEELCVLEVAAAMPRCRTLHM